MEKDTKNRSPRQIKWWLITKWWYNRYVNNLFMNYGDDNDSIDLFLRGEMGTQTISAAFVYRETPEGILFWGKVEERFLRWYFHQGKEIFRCKWFTIQI